MPIRLASPDLRAHTVGDPGSTGTPHMLDMARQTTHGRALLHTCESISDINLFVEKTVKNPAHRHGPRAVRMTGQKGDHPVAGPFDVSGLGQVVRPPPLWRNRRNLSALIYGSLVQFQIIAARDDIRAQARLLTNSLTSETVHKRAEVSPVYQMTIWSRLH